MRHEQKHLIRPEEALVLAGRLGKLFKRDSHAGEDGSYRVTSLYFDTPYDSALREKIGGVNPVSYTHLYRSYGSGRVPGGQAPGCLHWMQEL